MANSRVTAVLASEGLALDSFTGRVTPFNLLDAVFSPRFPALLPKLFVVVHHEGSDSEPDEFEQRVVVFAPDNKEIITSSGVPLRCGRTHWAIQGIHGQRFDVP